MSKPSTSTTTSSGRAVRQDGTSAFAEGESFKTGSESKRERLDAFIEWLLTPESEREPKTKKAWADKWGVSTQTVHNDVRDPYVQRELTSRARAVARVDRLPDILESLYRITQGDNADGTTKYDRFGQEVFPSASASVSAANKLLDWMEQTREIREGNIDTSKMSDEQLMEAALRLLDAVKSEGPEPE